MTIYGMCEHYDCSLRNNTGYCQATVCMNSKYNGWSNKETVINNSRNVNPDEIKAAVENRASCVGGGRSMLSNELLQMIAESPRAFLRRNYRTEEQIRVKQRRIDKIWSASVSITQALKPVVVYTGPGDKVGDAVLEITRLQEEIAEEVANLRKIQEETEEAIRLLVADPTLRAILEAYYLAGMRWEEIAVNFNYAYRWTMRLHRKALKIMQSEAITLLSPVQTASNESNETSNEIF